LFIFQIRSLAFVWASFCQDSPTYSSHLIGMCHYVEIGFWYSISLTFWFPASLGSSWAIIFLSLPPKYPYIIYWLFWFECCTHPE
jgi:hypothetical protein